MAVAKIMVLMTGDATATDNAGLDDLGILLLPCLLQVNQAEVASKI